MNPKTTTRGNRILLVDDDEDTLMTYKLWLETNGFQVDTYSSPLEALSNFKEKYYNLLLLDIRMPKMTGFELYEKLKGIDPDVKPCFVTSFEIYYANLKETYPDLKEYCFEQKPLSMERLLSLVVRRLH